MKTEKQAEFRCALTVKQVTEILGKAKLLEVRFYQDTYTGHKRLRSCNVELPLREPYATKVKGTIFRIALKLGLANVTCPVYLEFKATDKEFARWEIEFEDPNQVLDEFKDLKNIAGWQILTDQEDQKISTF